MRLHTNLAEPEVRAALLRAKTEDRITPDVHLTVFTPGRSQTHPHAYEIQLGTYDQDSLPSGYTDQNGRNLRVRRARNASHGEAKWAATWHEWGWFIAACFEADPGSRWGSDPARSKYPYGYFSPRDFHEKTLGEFNPQALSGVAYISGGNLVIPVPRAQG